jgi:hypothetical protein
MGEDVTMNTLSFVAENAGLIEAGGQMGGMIAIVAAVLVIAGGGLFFAIRSRNKNRSD